MAKFCQMFSRCRAETLAKSGLVGAIGLPVDLQSVAHRNQRAAFTLIEICVVLFIIALLVGQNLAGIPGMILSVPIATILVELMDDFARHKESKRSTS